jgi:hypothetical protein
MELSQFACVVNCVVWLIMLASLSNVVMQQRRGVSLKQYEDFFWYKKERDVKLCGQSADSAWWLQLYLVLIKLRI